jgi:hypothetical protein
LVGAHSEPGCESFYYKKLIDIIIDTSFKYQKSLRYSSNTRHFGSGNLNVLPVGFSSTRNLNTNINADEIDWRPAALPTELDDLPF